jgi:hypothetical protein
MTPPRLGAFVRAHLPFPDSLMPIPTRRRAVLLGALLIAAPMGIEAQSETPLNIDSLTTVLDSPDGDSRAAAVSALGTVNQSLLPPRTRLKLIALLERVAAQRAAPREPDGQDTAEGENLIQLVRLVARLQEPAATRALALRGINVNSASQRFVASQGDAALPFLIEAEQLDTVQRSSVTITRAYMLGEFGDRLSPQGRVATMAAILRTAAGDPTTFARAAELGGIVTAVPLVQQAAADEPAGLTKTLLADAVDVLVAMRSRTPVAGIVSNVATSLDALCGGAQGARLGACQSMRNELDNATNQIAGGRLIPAANALDALSKRATDAVSQGALEPWEGTLVSGTSAYLKTRI